MKAALWHKMHTFGMALPNLEPKPRGATIEVLALNLDLAGLGSRIARAEQSQGIGAT